MLVLYWITIACVLNVHGITGMDYLLAFAGRGTIIAASAESAEKFEVIYPDGTNLTRTLSPYSVKNTIIPGFVATTSITTGGIIVRLHTTSRVRILGQNDRSIFNPLPVSALGKEYVISMCTSPDSSFLLLASYQSQTNVSLNISAQGNITYRGNIYKSGQILQVSLGPLETVLLEAAGGITGTVVNSTNNFAIYSGALNVGGFVGFEQLLPITTLGTSFNIAFDERVIPYSVHILSASEGTVFNGTGVFISGFRGSFSIRVANGSSQFETDKPIAAVICALPSPPQMFAYGMSILPPVSIYSTDTTLPLLGQRLVIHTLGDQSSLQFNTAFPINLQPLWSRDNNTGLSVGTLDLPATQAASLNINSTDPFYVIVLSPFSLYTGGYNFESQETSGGGGGGGNYEDDGKMIIVGVAAGTGLATTAGMVVGGFLIHRERRRRRRRRNAGNAGNGPVRKDNNENPDESDRPAPPPNVRA